MSNPRIAPPFEIGDRVIPADLLGWVYTGLSGRPGEKGATRRYIKGMWVLELIARTDRKSTTRVMAIRTLSEDKLWWAAKSSS